MPSDTSHAGAWPLTKQPNLGDAVKAYPENKLHSGSPLDQVRRTVLDSKNHIDRILLKHLTCLLTPLPQGLHSCFPWVPLYPECRTQHSVGVLWVKTTINTTIHRKPSWKKNLANTSNLIFKFILCAWVFSCMCARAPLTCLVPTQDRRGHQVPWNRTHTQLSVTL